ncbi:MAG TPA: FAD/NAD(P)-binding protein [Nocardioidaceae bacterium]|nr:FAD/NAD(P)-binding protein [Nocardioidaceae bacterium]
MTEHRVVIVGGGAAGTLTTISLLRQATTESPVAVTLVEKRDRVGPGLAYSTDDLQHLLNNTVGQMSALVDDPGHFARWLAARGRPADSHAFVPRAWYGEYLSDLLASAPVPEGSSLEIVTAEVLDLTETPGGVTALLDDGRSLIADTAVLAVGNPAPPRRTVAADVPVVNDPWAPGALDRIGVDDRVLLLGTGLTMVDVALTLAGSRAGVRLTAVSRHGLLPQRHVDEPVVPRATVPVPAYPLSGLVRTVREEVRRAGGDWRSVVDGMRPHLPALWERLGPEGRTRFLRHLARHWEVHRHRMAPQVAVRLDALQGEGLLTVRTTQGIDLTDFDHVVNCTGPQPVGSPGWSVLVDHLVDRGLARPDSHGLGLDTDVDGALLTETGLSSRRVFTLGYARRGVSWECTAVPEIRTDAARLARRLHQLQPAPA